MRVEFGSPSGAGASRNEQAAAELRFYSDDLLTAAAMARSVGDIYENFRQGRKIAVLVDATVQDASTLASAIHEHCSKIGIQSGQTSAATDVIENALAQADVAIAVAELSPQCRKGPPRRRRFKVAVAGLGQIGAGVALRLLQGSLEDYDFCAAFVRQPARDREIVVDQITNDVAAFLATRPDVIIDALPDGETGRRLIEAALERGVSIVSANKQAIAGALSKLHSLASTSGAALHYSASVGGGAPFLETVARTRSAGEIVAIEAVLNGTVNYVVTALAAGLTFDKAVADAQAAGFAEPDPTADLSGEDARAKLAILAFAAFGEEIPLSSIDIEPLDEARVAAIISEGGIWKQIARLDRDRGGRLTASVRFEKQETDSFFAQSRWEENALRLTLKDGAIAECRGKGAGRAPTVESIFGDLRDVANGLPSGATPSPIDAVPA